MSEFDDKKIAHLGMIQGVVSRLETNCFTLKALAMTITAAVLAFLGTIEHPSCIYPLAAIIPLVIFWLMDAQYLRLGRLFRRLFDGVRKGEIQEPFTMCIEQYIKEEQSVLRIAFSWSIFWFYGTLLVAFVGIILFLN